MEPKRPIKTFEDLIVWQQAHRLTLLIYRLSKGFPQAEVYGLTSQIRRSASSISANIVEGFARGRKEFMQFLTVANGSLEETKYHLRLAKDLEYLEVRQYDSLRQEYERLGKLLNALRRSLRPNGPRP